MRVGLMDSGVGGLSVAFRILEEVPDAHLVYLGDTARFPYGSRSLEEIRTYVLQAMAFFREQRVDAAVIACNTATIAGLDAARRISPFPVLGVVGPGARAAAKATSNGIIGLIGTEATVKSGAYERMLKSIRAGVRVVARAAPELTELAERGKTSGREAEEAVERAIEPLLEHEIDTLLVGCTHHSFFQEAIAVKLAGSVTLVDPAVETARELRQVLDSLGKDLPYVEDSHGTAVMHGFPRPGVGSPSWPPIKPVDLGPLSNGFRTFVTGDERAFKDVTLRLLESASKVRRFCVMNSAQAALFVKGNRGA